MVSERVNTTEEELTPAGIQDILSGGGVSFGATLAGVNPYVNCTTELVRQNTISVPPIPTGPSFGVTETGSVGLDEPVSSVLSHATLRATCTPEQELMTLPNVDKGLCSYNS